MLIGKPEEKRLLESLRSSWKDNINMHLRKIKLESVKWINLAQKRNR
jgi:hypothetical protein